MANPDVQARTQVIPFGQSGSGLNLPTNQSLVGVKDHLKREVEAGGEWPTASGVKLVPDDCREDEFLFLSAFLLHNLRGFFLGMLETVPILKVTAFRSVLYVSASKRCANFIII